MFLRLFESLRSNGIPVTVREYLDLIGGLNKGICNTSHLDEFYNFSRMCLVKDEKYFDKFDQVFKTFYDGNKKVFENLENNIPENWILSELQKMFSEDFKKSIKNNKKLEEILNEFKKKLREQKKRHEGGNKWIGTGGSSMFGNSGFNTKGIRVGGNGGSRSALKIWEKRTFKNLDEDATVNSRNLKLILRRLRRFAREGAEKEFDLDNTIDKTAKNAGLLDIKYRPEKANTVRLILFIDVGGSMDEHANSSQELFSAAKSEFKSLEYFYFHNCLYEKVWKNNLRRTDNMISVDEIIRNYRKNTKIIFIGDALMSPYEVTYPGGSIEHWNEKPGSYWLEKVFKYFNKTIWLNPEKNSSWQYAQSTLIISEIFEKKMFQLNLKGIESAIKELAK